MSFPTSQSIPPEDEDFLSPARQRRQRRRIPPAVSDSSGYARELSRGVIPSVEFFLFSFLCGLVCGTAIYFDQPALYLLAALLAPFMAPVLGLGFASAVGSFTFFLQSLGGMIVGSSLVFAAGSLCGWISTFLKPSAYAQIAVHTRITAPEIILLAIGVILTSVLMVRSPRQRSLVASVAIAYTLYLPVCIAGYALTAGLPGVFETALKVFGSGLLWAVTLGMIVLWFHRLHPTRFFGILLTLALLAGSVALILDSAHIPVQLTPAGFSAAASPTPSLHPSATPTVTLIAPLNTNTPVPPAVVTNPTYTLPPSKTPTVTLTPSPTQLWAQINADRGAIIRKEPDVNSQILAYEMNRSLVEVLGEPELHNGEYWIQVRSTTGQIGWILRSLLMTATPKPNW